MAPLPVAGARGIPLSASRDQPGPPNPEFTPPGPPAFVSPSARRRAAAAPAVPFGNRAELLLVHRSGLVQAAAALTRRVGARRTFPTSQGGSRLAPGDLQ